MNRDEPPTPGGYHLVLQYGKESISAASLSGCATALIARKISQRSCPHLFYGCCSIATLIVLLLPVAASPTTVLAMPGSDAGAKLTDPSSAEVAVEDCVANSWAAAQRPCGGQGGAHAYTAW